MKIFDETTERNTENSVQNNLAWWVLIASGLLAISGAIGLNRLMPDWRMPHYPLHALMESFGAFAAFIVASLMLSLRRQNHLGAPYTVIAAGLMGMGLLDGFHAFTHAGKQFVWLHSMATFIGGMIFSLTWWAERFESQAWFRWIPKTTLIISVVLGIGSLGFNELIPIMVENGQFSVLARITNILGGTGFLMSAMFFTTHRKEQNHQGHILFSVHCMFFGLSGIIFEFSTIWDPAWWFWHALRAAAYLIAVFFYLRLTQQIFSQLHRLQQSLVIEKNKAQAANSAKSTFLANMSHEIRTPMNGVIGSAEMLGKTHLNDDQTRMLKIIKSSSKSLLRIIDDILDVSKIEAGKLTLEETPVNLYQEIETVMYAITPIAQEKNVLLQLFIDPQLPQYLLADPVRFRQVLINLLSNAIKFSGSETPASPGKVKLTIERDELNQMTVRVIDNGIGISKEIVSKLFQPFVQAEDSITRRFGGTGLGLVIIENLVRMMKGSIEVDSQLDEGSTFTITLPLTEIDRQDKEIDLSGLNVIALVDDEMEAEYIKKYFEFKRIKGLFVEDKTELYSATTDAPANTIVLLGLATMEENKRALQYLSNNNGQPPCLCFTKNRFDIHASYATKDFITLQCFPLLPSEFHHALAVLAERAAPSSLSQTKQPFEELKNRTQKNNHKLLLVEDNLINQQVIEDQLQLLGYTVEIAGNGKKGLEKWLSGNFDLILADCHMPEMDGYQMTEKLRKMEVEQNIPRTPIIAITANAMQGESERCLNAGMDDYLSKPFELDDLEKTLVHWLTS